MPKDQQNVLDLYFIRQLSVRKIGKQFQCSMTPIYQRLSKALYMLKSNSTDHTLKKLTRYYIVDPQKVIFNFPVKNRIATVVNW